mgnify:CR=1 FL=1
MEKTIKEPSGKYLDGVNVNLSMNIDLLIQLWERMIC